MLYQSLLSPRLGLFVKKVLSSVRLIKLYKGLDRNSSAGGNDYLKCD